ncbi:MAG TPA: hypothetical protein VHC40_05740 [Rhizomicrobium sp.]|nr:hypothetical protein [Rhizomicrobium sp.]
MLTGDTADQHQFQGYDGYMALAGFAWTLSLVSNYIDTGKIRHRGDFPGRHSVRASALARGSLLADFTVFLTAHPEVLAVLGIPGAIATNVVSSLIYDVAKRVIGRNLGQDDRSLSPNMTKLLDNRGGDIEALVAATEASIRQSHSVIGNGAQAINIYGGNNIINVYNDQTRQYVLQNVEDPEVHEKNFSVAAFNANSGYGSVFDFDLGRTVPISMTKEVLSSVRSTFTWGLDQYANRTGKHVSVTYRRIFAMDGTPKRYVVLKAKHAV